MFLILAVCGFAAIPYVYLFSYKQTVSGGFALFLLSSQLIGTFGTVVIVILDATDEYAPLAKKLMPIAMLIPPFSVTFNGVTFARKAVSNFNWANTDEGRKNTMCMIDPNPCCSKKHNYNGYDRKVCRYMLSVSQAIITSIDPRFYNKTFA